MRGTATTRLSVSLLGAAALHGAVFGVAAAVLSHRGAERAVPAALDVDLLEVSAPRPDPIADAAPGPALVPAKLVVPARRPRALAHAATALDDPSANLSTVESTAKPDVAPGPSVAVPLAAPGPPVAAQSARGPAAAAPSAGATISAQPRYRFAPKPVYPLPSLRRREEGVVLVKVVIHPDGSLGAVTVDRSSGYPLLDRAALDAVRNVPFEPLFVAGVPVSSTGVIPIHFSLSDEP